MSAREPLVNLKISANEDSLAYRPGIDGQLAFLSMIVGSGCDCGPTESARQRFEDLKSRPTRPSPSGTIFRKAMSPRFRNWPPNEACSRWRFPHPPAGSVQERTSLRRFRIDGELGAPWKGIARFASICPKRSASPRFHVSPR